MRAYVMTTGAVFALIVVAHIWRAIEEGSALAKDPAYVAITLFAVALCIWAYRLFEICESAKKY